MREQGMRSVSELSDAVNDGKIATVAVVFTDIYGRLMGKRLDANYFLRTIQAGQNIGACNYLLAADMEMDPILGFDYSNWEKGFGDMMLRPDLDSLRVISWQKETALVICDAVEERSGEEINVVPRSVLHRQIRRLQEHGFHAMAASELEYYTYRDNYQQAHEKNYQNLQPIGWYSGDYHLLQGAREEPFMRQLRHHLAASGIAVENSKGETGIGQSELNVVYTDVLKMADHHGLFKQCLKEVAEAEGYSVSFMTKVSQRDAGSSCHMHISLVNDRGENVFAHENGETSETFRWFLGGLLTHTPELLVLLAPTVNSYKRFRSGSWAPTRLAWSMDNRTAAYRVVGHGPSLRIECRIPGADVNPYLGYSALLAAGLDGIEKRIDPGPSWDGNVYEAHDAPSFPLDLGEAVTRFERSEWAHEAFGSATTAHLSHFYTAEWNAYAAAVTDWECRRYFERI